MSIRDNKIPPTNLLSATCSLLLLLLSACVHPSWSRSLHHDHDRHPSIIDHDLHHLETLAPLYRGERAVSYIANQTACIVDGDVYRDGDAIPTDDPCETCKCRPPGFACVLRECEIKPGCKAIRREGECCPHYQCGCEHGGRFFGDGERIPNAESPCYSCYCQGSSITCALADCKFRFDCEPEYVPGECCPRYDHCPPEPTLATTARATTIPPTTTAIPTTTTRIPSTENTPSVTSTASLSVTESLVTTVYSIVDEVTTSSKIEGVSDVPGVTTTLEPILPSSSVSSPTIDGGEGSTSISPASSGVDDISISDEKISFPSSSTTTLSVEENKESFVTTQVSVKEDIPLDVASNEEAKKSPANEVLITISPPVGVSELDISSPAASSSSSTKPLEETISGTEGPDVIVSEDYPTTTTWVPTANLTAEHRGPNITDNLTSKLPPPQPKPQETVTLITGTIDTVTTTLPLGISPDSDPIVVSQSVQSTDEVKITGVDPVALEDDTQEKDIGSLVVVINNHNPPTTTFRPSSFSLPGGDGSLYARLL